MVYGALPPEVNSGRMYAGPGATSMLAAAAAWDGLAVDLNSAAIELDTALTGLVSGPWLGATATTMAAAAAPYLSWLNATAAQAEEVAAQAKSAIAAYETAYAMTVHPALVAANRARLMTLIATNLLGQNAAAIAATEIEYGEMWAQDAAAMYGYVAGSTAATRLSPLTPPPPAANPSGLANQAAAVVQATGNSAATNITGVLSDMFSAVSAVSAPGATVLPGWITDLDTVMSIFGTPFFVCTSSAGLMMSMLSTIKGLFPAAAAIGSQVATSLGSAAAGALSPAGLTGAVSAAVGEGATIGPLSVPPAWAASAPTLSHAAVGALPGAVSGAAPSLGSASPGLLGGLPLSGAGSRAEAAANATQDGITPLRVLPQFI